MKTFTVEFELRGHEHRYNATIIARDIAQAREIFMRENPRCEIISVNEICQKCGEDLQTNRPIESAGNFTAVCDLCAK